MKGYPLFLKLEGERCLVFGGGNVARRKIQTLLKRGARITCVSRSFSTPLKNLAKKNRLQLILKKTGEGRALLNGARLVVAATSDASFNARVAQSCRKAKILVNVVDNPELCDFYVPAVLERGPLQIAISTGGTSPLFSRRLREALEKVIPPSIGRLLEEIGRLRRQKIKEGR